MDARVRYTQKTIREVFLSLLKDTPLDKITVTSICEHAQINRATFYKYYDNPYDLLQKLEQQRLTELHEEMTRQGANNFLDIFRIVLTDIKKYKEFYQILFSENGDEEFRSQIFSACYQYNMETIRTSFPDLSQQKQEWLFYFIAEACNGLLQKWLSEGMTASVDEVVTFTRQLVDSIHLARLF